MCKLIEAEEGPHRKQTETDQNEMYDVHEGENLARSKLEDVNRSSDDETWTEQDETFETVDDKEQQQNEQSDVNERDDYKETRQERQREIHEIRYYKDKQQVKQSESEEWLTRETKDTTESKTDLVSDDERELKEEQNLSDKDKEYDEKEQETRVTYQYEYGVSEDENGRLWDEHELRSDDEETWTQHNKEKEERHEMFDGEEWQFDEQNDVYKKWLQKEEKKVYVSSDDTEMLLDKHKTESQEEKMVYNEYTASADKEWLQSEQSYRTFVNEKEHQDEHSDANTRQEKQIKIIFHDEEWSVSELDSVNELTKPQSQQDGAALVEELQNEHQVSEDEQLWDRQHYSYKRSEHDEQLLEEQNAEHKISDDKKEEKIEQNVSGEDEAPYEENWFGADSNEEKHLQNEEDEKYETSDKEQLKRWELEDSMHEHISEYHGEQAQLELDEEYKTFDDNNYLHKEQSEKEADKYDIVDEDELQNENGAHKVANDGKQMQEEQRNTHDHIRSNKQSEIIELSTSVKKRNQQTRWYTEMARRRVYKWTIFQSHVSRRDAQTKDDRKQFDRVCPPCVCP